MAGRVVASVDPAAAIRSRQYALLLVLAAPVGVVVSVAAWGFLELAHWIPMWVFEDLPEALGFDSPPTWWPLPVLAVAGVIVAFAIERLPGRGGHVPSEGLKAGAPQPIELPGIAIAGLGSIALGLVLGPEGPLIALGSGLGLLAMRLAKKDAPNNAGLVMAAAGSFAAVSSIFGSPAIGAVIIIEAAGLGGRTLPLILLPGLLSAGVGSLVFTGLGHTTSLSTSDYALSPLELPEYSAPTLADFAWVIPLAVVVAVLTVVVVEIARGSHRVVATRPFVLMPVAGMVVAGLAIAFHEVTDEPAMTVLLSGQEALEPTLSEGASFSRSTLAFLILFKALAWAISLGNFRGGPIFPAMYLGMVGGVLVADLPGLSETPAVAALMGAATVSILRLPLSSVFIALILTAGSGLGSAPLIIVAVVVAYVTVEVLAPRPAAEGEPANEATVVEPESQPVASQVGEGRDGVREARLPSPARPDG